MNAKRAVAAVVAVVLVVGAFVLRRNVIDADDEAAGSTLPLVEAPAELVCVSELAQVCQAIGPAHPELTVLVEPAGRTLDRLAELDEASPAPLWLTVEPFPAMVDSLRSAAGRAPLDASAQPVGASRLIVATPAGGRRDVLAAACAGTPLWRCIGASAGEPWTDLGGQPGWNTVRPSLGLVDESAMALGSFADAVAGYFGTPSISQSVWTSDPSFIPWLQRLSGAVDPQALSVGTPLATMAVRPALDVAASSEAEVTTVAAGQQRFEVSYPEPSMWLQAVLAVPEAVNLPDDLLAEVTTAATEAGWAAPATAEQPLPSATTMLGLRALWQDAT